MNKFLKFGDVISSKMKERYDDSYFLEDEFDSAIVGVGYVNNSIIYSLTRLAYQMMEEIESEGCLCEFEDRDDLYIYCLDHFYSLFRGLSKMENLAPPTLLFDIEDEFKVAS